MIGARGWEGGVVRAEKQKVVCMEVITEVLSVLRGWREELKMKLYIKGFKEKSPRCGSGKGDYGEQL